MQGNIWLPKSLELVSHPTARDKAVAKVHLNAGSCILSTPSFASILLESEKGQRCDNCFRIPPQGSSLKKCAGCGSYWYCDAQCQNVQWKAHHKKICKSINSFKSSLQYQGLALHEKHDSLLLSHTVARMALLPTPYAVEQSTLATVLLALLPHLNGIDTPPISHIKPGPSDKLLNDLYSRFGNNNFAVHSHLKSIGHGVFPVSSRIFNHSCLPNAAAKYIFSPTRSIMMEIVALRDIVPGEEICLPYLDPALLETRQQILELSYGFKCDCRSCAFLSRINQLPELPTDPNELSSLEDKLRSFAGVVSITGTILPDISIEDLPSSLYCLLRESYMTSLSEKFSKASHEGQIDIALQSGVTLLALYLVIYPKNYPQIGMHLLELAKTAWNDYVLSRDTSEGPRHAAKKQAEVFLTLASENLMIFGTEGDEDGPLQEILLLKNLLSGDGQCEAGCLEVTSYLHFLLRISTRH